METQVKEAREMWLRPNPDMAKVEQLYREALETLSRSKKRKCDADEKAKFSLECWQELAMEQLCMILCQSGRTNEAKPWLEQLGYTCRLAACVLDYPAAPSPINGQQLTGTCTSNLIPCQVWDHLLSANEIHHLQDVFADPKADYWLSHSYQVEPPSPYFSYIIPLQRIKTPGSSSTVTIQVDEKYGCLGSILEKLHSHLIQQFPKLSTASMVELWAHNRPHPTGHQFHFDSDNEGQGRMIKNPIMTAIVYLSGNGGGPSVITNQSLVSPNLATKGVLCHPSTLGRVVAFEGNLLHGVIPGKGGHSSDCRRVTLMLAYWRKIRVRPGETPGAARPFPFDTEPAATTSNETKWNRLLVRPSPRNGTSNNDTEVKPVEQEPMPISRVYETLDGEAWVKTMGKPEYQQVFQGF